MHRKILPFALSLVALGCSSPSPDTDPVRAPAAVTTDTEPLAAASATSFARISPHDVELVIHASRRAWVVLDAAPDAAWASGVPSLAGAEVEGLVAVERAIDAAKVPLVAKAAVGRRVRLLGRAGAVCEAAIDGLAIVGRVSPDGDAYARWRGEARDEEDRPVPAPTRSEIAREAWDLAEGSRALVGSLRPLSGRCDDATFAVLESKTTAIHPREATDAIRRVALTAFRALPEHRSHARDYAEEVGGASASVPWDSRDEATPVVETLAHGDQELVWVSAGAGGGCGDFSAQLSALFRRTSRGLEVVRVLDGWALELSAVVPRGRDYELVFPEARAPSSPASDVERLSIASYGCDC